MILESEDIKLEKAKYEDWKDMYRNVWSHPETAKYMEWSVTTNEEEYIATIVTVTEVKALRIDSAVVYRAIMEDIGFLRKCSNMLSDDLYKRSGNDGVFYYLSGIDRVRYFLTNYYNDHPERKNEKGQMIVQAEYQEIANTIGMSIRTVGRNLQRLRETDEIRSERKKIVIGQKQYENLMSHLYA